MRPSDVFDLNKEIFEKSVIHHKNIIIAKQIFLASMTVLGGIGATVYLLTPDVDTPTPLSITSSQLCNTNVVSILALQEEPMSKTSYLDFKIRADKFVDNGQHQQALELYYYALKIQSTNDAWNGIGYTQTFVCDNDSAIESFQNTLHNDENNINALNGLGLFYAKLLNDQLNNNSPLSEINLTTSSAKKYYNLVLSIDPNNINALNGLGSIHNVHKEFTEAIVFLNQSYDLEQNNISTINTLADAYYGLEDTAKAISYYEQSKNLKPDNLYTLEKLLVLYKETNNLDKVDETEKAIVESKSNVANTLIDTILWMQEEGHDVDKIEKWILQVSKLDPENKRLDDLLR